MDSCLAVDIGGTKLAAGIVTSRGELVAHDKVPTPREADAEGLFVALSDLVTRVAAGQRGLVACGVGCGGPMSEAGEEVSPLNIPAWVAFPLRSRLKSLTGLEVTVENDAKALALGEGWVGSAKGHRNFMGMVVSTGVGGGVVVGRETPRRRDPATQGTSVTSIVEPDGQPAGAGPAGVSRPRLRETP